MPRLAWLEAPSVLHPVIIRGIERRNIKGLIIVAMARPPSPQPSPPAVGERAG
jgi:hypothetical protein